VDTGFKSNVLPFYGERKYQADPLYLTPIEQQNAMVSKRLDFEPFQPNTSIYKSDYKSPKVCIVLNCNKYIQGQADYKRDFFVKTAIPDKTRDPSALPDVTGPV
jgi:hypothetical protein